MVETEVRYLRNWLLCATVNVVVFAIGLATGFEARLPWAAATLLVVLMLAIANVVLLGCFRHDGPRARVVPLAMTISAALVETGVLAHQLFVATTSHGRVPFASIGLNAAVLVFLVATARPNENRIAKSRKIP